MAVLPSTRSRSKERRRGGPVLPQDARPSVRQRSGSKLEGEDGRRARRSRVERVDEIRNIGGKVSLRTQRERQDLVIDARGKRGYVHIQESPRARARNGLDGEVASRFPREENRIVAGGERDHRGCCGRRGGRLRLSLLRGCLRLRRLLRGRRGGGRWGGRDLRRRRGDSRRGGCDLRCHGGLLRRGRTSKLRQAADPSGGIHNGRAAVHRVEPVPHSAVRLERYQPYRERILILRCEKPYQQVSAIRESLQARLRAGRQRRELGLGCLRGKELCNSRRSKRASRGELGEVRGIHRVVERGALLILDGDTRALSEAQRAPRNHQHDCKNDPFHCMFPRCLLYRQVTSSGSQGA